MINRFFKDQALYFEYIRVIGKALEHGADVGECIHTAQQINEEGNMAECLASWHDEWRKLAERIEVIGDECLSKGHPISARDAYFRAAEYYRTADFFLHTPENPDNPEVLDLWQKMHQCFNKARELHNPSFEAIKIPYENTTLPGYLMTVQTGRERPAPTVIVNTGFDGTAEELVCHYGFDLVRRGYNALLFEGPGQGAALRKQKLYFRPDWEKVIVRVVDYALTRPEIDPDRIALYGISMGGYLAPRAAAYEHRLAACIANGGIFDFFESNISSLGMTRDAAVEFVLSRPAEVDRVTREAMMQSIQVFWGSTHGPWAFGVKTSSEFMKKQIDYTLKDCVERIECPMLVVDVEEEQFFGGQAKKLYDSLKCSKTKLVFHAAEGAELHCQEGALLLSNQRIFDWLDDTLR